jgi:hypothetical protein
MKKIDCYIIYAKDMTYKKTTIDNDVQTFYDIINTDSISVLGRYINGKLTQIVCDEEGKLKENPLVSASSSDFRETLVGNLIINSTDNEIANIIDKYGVLVYDLRKDCKSNDNEKRTKRYN